MNLDTVKSLIDTLPDKVLPILKTKEEHRASSNRFNYFEVISDYYRRETFHSDVLFTLLNPETKEIGEICKNVFLRCFLSLFNVPFNPDESYFVRTEDPANTEESNGRIDISIVGNGYSIIIENKINFAAEQKNQLARYVESEREKNPNNKIVIVYLTLFPDESQKPAVGAYSKKYQSIVNEFNKTIPLHLWAASNTRTSDGWNKPSLIELLDDCINHIKKDMADSIARTSLVFMEQYRNLLEMIGGEKMECDAKLEILDYLGKTEKESSMLYEIIKEKDKLFARYIKEKYKAEESKWEVETIDGVPVYILKSFKNYKLFLWLPDDFVVQIGMVFPDKEYGKTKEYESRKKLRSVLEKYKSIKTIQGAEEHRRGQVQWYYFSLAYNFKPLEEAYQAVKNFIDVFPSEFSEEF